MTTPTPGRVLVIGEALVDVVQGIPTPGGSPANVAVGLARLKIPVELATQLGTDEHGSLLAKHLAGNGVELSPSTIDTTVRTATAVATLNSSGAATYLFDIDWRPRPPALPDGCVAVHTGSIATVLEPGASTVRDVVRSLAGQPVTVCLDPNARPAITPDPERTWVAVAGLAAYADLVKLSDEDCAFLRPDLDPAQLAAELLTNERTKAVVVTLGGAGAIGITRTDRIQVAAPSIEVVDTVGAGDSFMSALIAGLHAHDLLGNRRLAGMAEPTFRAVIDYAVRAAAITCTRHGADPPSTTDLTD